MLASRFLQRQERRRARRLPCASPHSGGWKRLVHAAPRAARSATGAGSSPSPAALLAGALLLWPLIPVELAPQTDADEIDIELEMARGTNIAVARGLPRRAGGQGARVVPAGNVQLVATEVRGDSAAVELKLEPLDRRHGQHRAGRPGAQCGGRTGARRRDRGRGATGAVDAQPGLQLGRRQSALEIELRGWDLDRADLLAAEIRRRMERLPGITDVG